MGGGTETPKPTQWVPKGAPYIEGPQRIFWGGSEGNWGGNETPKPPQWVQEGLCIKGGPQRIFWGGQKGWGRDMETPKPPQWLPKGAPYIEGPQRIFWWGQRGDGGENRDPKAPLPAPPSQTGAPHRSLERKSSCRIPFSLSAWVKRSLLPLPGTTRGAGSSRSLG